MKNTKAFFWIISGLFSAFMLFSAVPEILNTKDEIAFMDHLGYPGYLGMFLGVAKILGVIGILVPGFPRIKEWAYAGFAFDLAGATYSQIATDGFLPQELFMLLPIAFLVLSYFLYHKMKQPA
jgi:hypothetical protein